MRMISRRVEISIAGGEEEMVRVWEEEMVHAIPWSEPSALYSDLLLPL